jgi:glycosyltransferase involved in cell wall biosynthesis
VTTYVDIPHCGRIADVCLVLEGCYPYITGGVSSWTHDLLLAQQDLTFHLVCLMPAQGPTEVRYEVPQNVISLTNIQVDKPRRGAKSTRRIAELIHNVEGPVSRILAGGSLADLRDLIDALAPVRDRAGEEILLNHATAWEMLLRIYEKSYSESSFLDCFWTWRAVLGGLYAVLLSDLPLARLYHPLSTGYAGLFASRAHLDTGRPVLLTEHGIYTNERRIEIAMANWLHQKPGQGLNLQPARGDLRDMWINSFISYSHSCYEAASEIVTLYEGNQEFQSADGAPSEKLTIIPNGIDYERFSAVVRHPGKRLPTIALIARVVPIKDIKTFIRACAFLKQRIPEFRALVLGPTDEDQEYFEECQAMVEDLELGDQVTFTGSVSLVEYLGVIDVVVLTSISEAQPLVILEGGAAGVPAVATDVGACREMLLGRSDEKPALGPGGIVTPLANPLATANAVGRLLNDPAWHESCSIALRERVCRSYNKTDLNAAYNGLYHKYCDAPDAVNQAEASRWRA